jgi:uncharacterized membrane protein
VEPTRDEPIVAPSREDPVVRGASGLIGGPLGRHARPQRRFWTPLRVVLAMTFIVCAFGYLQKAPCLTNPWNGSQYTHLCYSDTYALYFGEGLADGKVPYVDHPVEYPALIGVFMQGASNLAHLLPADRQARGFFDINAVFFAVCAGIVVAATLKTSGRRPWDAALVALAPGLLLTGLINWDLPAVAFTALGMLLWARRRPGWAGVLFGLAIATKFYPVVLFAPLFLLCLRGRRLRSFWLALSTAAVTWVAIYLPLWLVAPHSNVAEFYTLSRNRGADWGSIWYAVNRAIGHTFDPAGVKVPSNLNLIAAGSFGIALLAIALLIFFAPRRPRLPQVFFLTLAAFLLVNKVYSPQYVLWLLPLFVLARPRWGAFLFWQAAEVVYFVAIWLYLLDITHPGKGIVAAPYFGALTLREIAVLALCVLVFRDILRPEHDVVRRDGVDDPAGGVLDQAPDRGLPVPPPAPVLSHVNVQ